MDLSPATKRVVATGVASASATGPPPPQLVSSSPPAKTSKTGYGLARAVATTRSEPKPAKVKISLSERVDNLGLGPDFPTIVDKALAHALSTLDGLQREQQQQRQQRKFCDAKKDAPHYSSAASLHSVIGPDTFKPGSLAIASTTSNALTAAPPSLPRPAAAAAALSPSSATTLLVSSSSPVPSTRPVDVRRHSASYDRLVVPVGKKRRKHAEQESSMVAHVLARLEQPISPATVFAELGAGSGRLSLHFQGATTCLARHVLMDRLVFRSRNRCDATMDRASRAAAAARGGVDALPTVVRVTADINELQSDWLQTALAVTTHHKVGQAQRAKKVRTTTSTTAAVDACCPAGGGGATTVIATGDEDVATHTTAAAPLGPAPEQVVYISKHLCGPATDAAVRLAVRARPEIVAIAPCCHYLLEDSMHSDYANPGLLVNAGLNASQVKGVALCSQWATLGHISRSAPATSSSETSGVSSSSLSGLLRADKQRLGRACKRLLDVGRAVILARQGYATWLGCYTDATLEDGLLLAWRVRGAVKF